MPPRTFLLWLTLGLITIGSSVRADEIRAIWVTRWDYTTAADVRAILDNIASHNFNTVLFQVRGNGSTFYPSALEPWAFELSGSNPSTLGTDPGWDPLALAVEYGHGLGLEIHAYMNTYPGWRGTTPPPDDTVPQQLWHSRPEWFIVNNKGVPQALNSHYVVLSPGIVAVREYLADIYEEVVTNYDVDGIHFDYVRYFGSQYSWDTESLARFAAEYPGATPDTHANEWGQWRRDQVTDLVAQVEGETHTAEPEMVVSAAVWNSYSIGRTTYGQDSWQWMTEGLLDVSHPMIYDKNNSMHRSRTEDHLTNAADRHMSAGIGAHLMEDDSSTFLSQIETTRVLGAHGCTVFAYASLFNKSDHAPRLLANALIAGPFRYTDEPLPRRWLTTDGDDDNTGPRISQPSTDPANPAAQVPFRFRVSITDPSGVFDDNTGPEGQGVFLRWSDDGNPASGEAMTMSHVGGGVYETDSSITITEVDETTVLFQVTAHDDDTDTGVADRASRESAILSFDVAPPGIFIFDALIGPTLDLPQYAVTDPAGMIWVCDYGADEVRVFDANGNPAPFDPITEGLNGADEVVDIDAPSGIACGPDGTIWVTLDDDYTAPLYHGAVRFNSQTGAALAGMDLPFRPGDCDLDSEGNFYAVEKINDRWHVFTQASGHSASFDFGPGTASHINRGLACRDDGSMVYIASQADGSVHAWQRASSDPPVYNQIADLTTVSGQNGGIDVDEFDWAYTADAQLEGGRVFDENGDVLQILTDGAHATDGLRGVAFAPDGNAIYLVRFVDDKQVQRWVRVEPRPAPVSGLMYH